MTTLQPREPYSPKELRKLYPEGLQLQLVQILLRHGVQYQLIKSTAFNTNSWAGAIACFRAFSECGLAGILALLLCCAPNGECYHGS
jgi:hypothetical protein